MKKIYFVRHQAHGIVSDFPFETSPSEEQVALVAKWCFHIHGFGHPKTPEAPWWTMIVERDVYGPADLPKVPDRELSVAGEPGTAKSSTSVFVASGTGHVGGKP